jgi:hypothetical protein
MSRRRPAQREHFSFDSFLDLVTNVVGIIIRLILVVWVGARTYATLPEYLRHPKATAALPAPKLEDDPLSAELERQRRALADAQKELLDQLRQFDLVKQSEQKTKEDLSTLAGKRQELLQVRGELDQLAAQRGNSVKTAALTLSDLEKRREKLMEEIKALEKQPPVKKTLRYRTPVSQPVHAEELHFECRYGKATFIDINTMLTDVRQNLENKGRDLNHQWEVNGMTDPVGPFRMDYTIERQRSTLDEAFPGPGPAGGRSGFAYGLSEWHIEPLVYERGEPVDRALQPNSDFRHIVDGLSPTQAVVTLWVYPDSFDIYRRLRDYLQDREITVAGRPLPDGMPIASSRRGSVSRGQ